MVAILASWLLLAIFSTIPIFVSFVMPDVFTGIMFAALYVLAVKWQALLAPFTAIATPAMMEGVTRMYDHIDEWKDERQPPFASAVWDFIRSVGAARQM